MSPSPSVLALGVFAATLMLLLQAPAAATVDLEECDCGIHPPCDVPACCDSGELKTFDS